MSRVTRNKHVRKEMLEDDFELPTAQQQIVRVVSSRGNNLHEVEAAGAAAGEKFLVTMPNKYRNNVWVKRGDFVIVEPIEEGDKVKAEICKILTADHVREYTKAGIWPKEFTKKRAHVEDDDSEEEAAGNGDKFMVRNRNRPTEEELEEDDDDTDDEETTDDE